MTDAGGAERSNLQDFSCGTPTGKELLWLHQRGVSMAALTRPWIIGADRVRFDGKAGFDFDAAGDRALIFRCEDLGETIDLAAWSDNRLATWRQTAFCLGDVDQCFNPATWFGDDGLRIHADPLDWLRARRAGIVILKPELCWAYLRNVPRVICQNEIIAARVHKHARPPRCTTKIFVAIAEKEIAA
jgi:hypothetical protein